MILEWHVELDVFQQRKAELLAGSALSPCVRRNRSPFGLLDEHEQPRKARLF